MNSQNDYSIQEQIQKYLNGELNESEQASLRDQLKADSTLAEDFNFSKDLKALLDHEEVMEVKSLLIAASKEVDIQPDYEGLDQLEGPSRGGWFKPGIALGIVVLLSIVVGLLVARFGGGEQQRYLDIASSFTEPMEILVVTNQADGMLYEGMRAYKEGDYQTAKSRLGEYLKNKADERAQLYLGIAQVLSNDGAEATITLQPLSSSSNPLFKSAASWYLSLAYIQTGKMEKAKKLLQSLENDSEYGNRAAQLLIRLAE